MQVIQNPRKNFFLDDGFIRYSISFLLILSFVRQLFGFQVYFDSIAPLLISIFLFRLPVKIKFEIILPTVVFCLFIFIQIFHPSILNILYIFKALLFFYISIFFRYWFFDIKNIKVFIYSGLIVFISLALIEFLFYEYEQRTLLSGFEVIRLNGIYGHHNYSVIIYTLLATLAYKNNFKISAIFLTSLCVLAGSNGFYVYLILGGLIFLFNSSFVKFFALTFHFISWTLPFWFNYFLNYLSDIQYQALAILTNFRSVHWEVYSNMALDNLLIGTGYTQSLENYSIYDESNVKDFDNIQIHHNLSLEIITQFGILGWFFVGFLISFLILRSSSKLQLFFSTMLFVPYVLYNGFTFIGLWLALSLYMTSKK